MQVLVQYLIAAILSWTPVRTYYVPYGETEDEARARITQVAVDIATVAMDTAEPPVFSGPDGRLKTALLQASIGSMETSFQRFVDDGTCNKPGYSRHADRRGDCDGGQAWSFWSIHVYGGGYLLLEDGTLATRASRPDIALAHPELLIRGPELIADHKTALRVAQRAERSSIRQFNSLCAYSGEPCAEGRHPKAAARLDRAKTYLRDHPFPETLPTPIAVLNPWIVVKDKDS